VEILSADELGAEGASFRKRIQRGGGAGSGCQTTIKLGTRSSLARPAVLDIGTTCGRMRGGPTRIGRGIGVKRDRSQVCESVSVEKESRMRRRFCWKRRSFWARRSAEGAR
jgi:hypothetical protein